MLEELKEEVLKANLFLPKFNLVTLTWGNVSAINRELGLIVIKPSGVKYETMQINDLVVVDMDGNVVEGSYNPSSDTPTHLILYKNFKNIGSIIHTHSVWATSWAQAIRDLPALGTTHADNFHGDIPCTRSLTLEEISSDYETETGKVIVETFIKRKIDPDEISGCLVYAHGPFVWGATPMKALENAIVLEESAKIAFNTVCLNSKVSSLDKTLLDKHFYRKHGTNAYYGQSCNFK
ncbi:MAG TPA: L-ribulose-5-phosphate 4-epimerase [Tepidanaerobacter syntrophicus]|uniref:L-ribulose-5-phosphate 4-epimerase n=1 Tax=Tepidanaerobacter syntrophicus TaxID=224999 RepID=UPI001777B643|nr:L-ribulose-5-phosphate 4-epimerase [Tepidanaerobacter syntrophicus]HHV82875.1 L-ribulose-5-phosphate 4-epimerase [Tepidanaerobacter syntrophicus]